MTTTSPADSPIAPYIRFERSLLPLANMDACAARAPEYASGQPFQHIVADDFFDPAILDRVIEEFPDSKAIDWKRYDDPRFEVKLASKSEAQIGLFTRYLLYSLNSATFIEFLERLTGIQGLIPDPHLWGGGLHQILPAGKLAVHTDFNKQPALKLDRRLNVLIYLNRDWREEWGGHLELWDRDMRQCEKRLLPVFNRFVCFSTNATSYHGHPNELRCPPGRTRRSLALYYYSNGRPAHEVRKKHSTLFQLRPEDAAPASIKHATQRFVARMRGALTGRSDR